MEERALQKTLELFAHLCYNEVVTTLGWQRIKGMPIDEWNTTELLSLPQVAALLRRAHKPRHPQSLYDRIRRGTLVGVRQNGKWHIPEPQVQQLLLEPYHRRGGRPKIKDTRMFIHRPTRRRVEIPDVPEIARLLRLPVEKRAKLALRTHILARNTVRARLELQYPRLSRREISLKVVAELSRGD